MRWTPPFRPTPIQWRLPTQPRAAAPGHLLLYRVGVFYEVLGDDAEVVFRALGIQLIRRLQKDAPTSPCAASPPGRLARPSTGG